MSSNCVVPGCDNINRVRSNVMFHCFPRSNSKLCKLWLTAMGYMPTDTQMMTRVCSDHFLKCDYKNKRGSKVVKLKQTAVPSIFPRTLVPSIQTSAAGQKPSEIQASTAETTGGATNENASDGTAESTSATEGNQSRTPVEQIPSPLASDETDQAVLADQATFHPSDIHENSCESGDQQHSQMSDGVTTVSDVAGNENARLGTEGNSSSPAGKKSRMPVIRIHNPAARIVADSPVIVDESTFHPSRIHEDYCRLGSVQWADGTWENVSSENSKKAPSAPIQTSLLWQWLGMDIKGPLPKTHEGHTHILTVMDFYSKWVEAFPMKSLSPAEVALNIHSIICKLGHPRQIVSRLNKTFIREVNMALKTYMDALTCSLVVFHPETCVLDLLTQSYIDSMVSELVKDHQKSWDLQLPASLFSLRCREHPSTHYSPFYMLYSRESCVNRLGSRHQPLVEDQLVGEELDDAPEDLTTPQGSRPEPSGALIAEPSSSLDLLDVEEVLVVQCECCSQWDCIPPASEAQTSREKGYTCAACRETKDCRKLGRIQTKP
ncbi:hypothetical protein GJAV_G00268840 [Gymnothorax javanicus]|nr:hypothetical protein GJAV_G00268840 [Gymnothorax javanicus]